MSDPQPEGAEMSRDALLEALGQGLLALDRHKWAAGPPFEEQWESLAVHYRRDAERFLLPHLARASIRLI